MIKHIPLDEPAIPDCWDVCEMVGGTWAVLCNGFQWGHGPYDLSGCSGQEFATRGEAVSAVKNYVLNSIDPLGAE